MEEDFDSIVKNERSRLGSEKKKQKDTARLVWASKPRKEPSAKDLVFQTAEEVYPNKATGNLASYFEKDKQDISKNPNRLIWGDNLLVMQALLAQGYEGQIDLIYIDPPFNTGESYNFSNKVKIGDEEFEKELPVSERLAYTDTWDRGLDSFLDMLYPRLQLMKRLLSENGSVYVHLDWHAAHYAKIIMDEIFGRENFRNEIIWWYYNKMQGNIGRFASNHDVIFSYRKGDKPFFKVIKELRENPKKQQVRVWDPKTQSLKNKRDERGNPMYYEDTHRTIDDVWKMSYLVPADKTENLKFATQKPEKLITRIIESSCPEGGIVADFFCGSGTTAAVAEKLGRRWITSDLSKTAIQVTRSRLVNQSAKPFLIENLGNYQRQLIYLHEVKLKEMYDIILNLYGARPREDRQGVGISNTDKSTLVYVSEPDRPMTAKKAVELARDAVTLDGRGYRNLVILAWDYDYNYDEDLKRNAAKSKLANIESKVIPSDVYKYLRNTNVGETSLSDKITFYQKPYVRISEPQISGAAADDEKIVKLSIDQYVIMDNPIRDEEERKEVENLLKKNYSHLIDFWAVDYDYDSQVFRSRWQAIRDRKSGKPVTTTADFRLKTGKKYKIAIRVVDVFGNDACATKEINVR